MVVRIAIASMLTLRDCMGDEHLDGAMVLISAKTEESLMGFVLCTGGKSGFGKGAGDVYGSAGD